MSQKGTKKERHPEAYLSKLAAIKPLCHGSKTTQNDSSKNPRNHDSQNIQNQATYAILLLLHHSNNREDQTRNSQNPCEPGQPAENQSNNTEHQTGYAHSVALLNITHNIKVLRVKVTEAAAVTLKSYIRQRRLLARCLNRSFPNTKLTQNSQTNKFFQQK